MVSLVQVSQVVGQAKREVRIVDLKRPLTDTVLSTEISSRRARGALVILKTVSSLTSLAN